MTTTPQDDFAGASPRPWKRDPSFACIRDPNQLMIVDCMGDHTSEFQDFENADLVVAAVNAYDPDRDAKLREAIRETLRQLREYKDILPPEMYNKLESKAFAALALLPEATTEAEAAMRATLQKYNSNANEVKHG